MWSLLLGFLEARREAEVQRACVLRASQAVMRRRYKKAEAIGSAYVCALNV